MSLIPKLQFPLRTFFPSHGFAVVSLLVLAVVDVADIVDVVVVSLLALAVVDVDVVVSLLVVVFWDRKNIVRTFFHLEETL